MSSTKEQILEKVQANLDAKMQASLQMAMEQAERDRENVTKALEMIEQRLMYKDVEQRGWGHKYVLATEEMFLKDYATQKEGYYRRGIRFADENEVYRGVFEVNGERYYDMRWLLNKYARDVEDALELNTIQRERLIEMKNKFDEAVNDWPKIKKIIKDWNKLQSKE